MQIKAHCVYDKQAITALMHLSFSKNEPKSALRTNWLLNCGLIALGVYIALVQKLSLGWVAAGIGVVTLALLNWMYFGYPKMRYKGMCKFADIQVEYTFTDSEVEITGSGGDYREQSHVAYNMLHRAEETGAYLFLYIDTKRAYIVNKAPMTPEAMAQVRGVLQQALQKKYNIRGY